MSADRPTDRATVLARLSRTPALAAATAVDSTPDSVLTDTDPDPDTESDRDAAGGLRGWTPVIVLGHLAYVDRTVWAPRLRQMAEQDVPRWQWWEPDGVDWVGLFAGRRLADVCADFAGARQGVVDHLAALTGTGWARRAHHDVFGDIDVAGLCAQILSHDAEHLDQIAGRHLGPDPWSPAEPGASRRR